MVEQIEETMLGECGLYFCVGYDLCFSRVYACWIEMTGYGMKNRLFWRLR